MASAADAFLALLAECGCTLCPQGLVLPARDAPHFQHKLEQRLSSDPRLLETFVAGFVEFISNDSNLRRLLASFAGGVQESIVGADSLGRLLLSIAPVQTLIANILLEKLPEYFSDANSCSSGPLKDSIPRLILNQFRWLDYLVEGENVTRKLMEVLSICPMGLKKEIITLIPEIVSGSHHDLVITTLEQMLQEEFQLIAPVLDAFSNLNLEEGLLDQVLSLAITSLRSADAEDLPLVVRFLLQSATTTNVKRIVHQLRENLHFTAVADTRDLRCDRKWKGKAAVANCEALALEAMRSGLRFQNVMSEAFLKEIKGLDKAEDHKVIDFWLLLVIYANGGLYKKLAESVIKRKVILGHFGKKLLQQCIHGRIELLHDYFQHLISISHGLLACKELAARQLGSLVYVLLFEEFMDAYHRQEVLGSLVTHTGSGIDYEVGSALDALLVISSSYARELLPISSFINGILDYLEGFQDIHLHQVYKVFGQLALAAWSLGSLTNGCSTANELSIVLRKQISNPDAKYKRMGIIGVVALISCLGAEDNPRPVLLDGSAQQATIEEALALLHTIMEVCNTSPVARGFFYDELALLCETTSLNSSIVEWISKQTIEFEALFLVDLDSGKIPTELQETESLQGDVWMNLDGDVSPILLNILNLLTSQNISSSKALLFLPSSFRLLSAVERTTNQGSLGNIDALLGCPLYLPKYQIFVGDEWRDLSRTLKETACISLFFGINWIRELINNYSTQIDGRNDNLTQATREEISDKLLKRLRNLIFLEHLLDDCMKSVSSLSFPQLHSELDAGNKLTCGQVQPSIVAGTAKRGRKRKVMDGEGTQSTAISKKDSSNSQINKGSQKQTTLQDSYGKKTNGAQPSENSQSTPRAHDGVDKLCKSNGKDVANGNSATQTTTVKEIGDQVGHLGQQRWKFRPLNIHSLSILCCTQAVNKLCCVDPSAELALHLYLLRDLHHKLECLDSPARKQLPWAVLPNSPKIPSGLGAMTSAKFFKRLEPLFPTLRRHLDMAAKVLCSAETGSTAAELGNDACGQHWASESLAAGNPENVFSEPSKSVIAESVFVVVIRCLSKMFANSEFMREHNMSTLMHLLSAFSSFESGDKFLLDLQPPPSSGTLEYAFCSVYTYLDELFDAAASASFLVASELVMSQKRLVTCAEACIEVSSESTRRRSSILHSPGVLPYLKSRLSISAGRVLRHEWEESGQGKNLKNRGDVLQQLLHVFIHYSESPIELLEELACNAMPQVPAQKSQSDSTVLGYPSLSPATFLIWYRVQHEELSNIFIKVVKDITALHKCKSIKEDEVSLVLVRARQCVTVMVALVNLTKIHDKIPIHSIAVKFGGKFVDTFLRGIDFLQAQYHMHKDPINALVKELQKATRTIQTLCSEAKGLKRMPVTCKIPAVKRSMERYVFCIKALLHSASQGKSFWMGNLKHKNLRGEEVGSQLQGSDEEREEAVSVGEDEDGEAGHHASEEVEETDEEVV